MPSSNTLPNDFLRLSKFQRKKILGRALEDGLALDMFIVLRPPVHNSENRAKLSKKVQTCENLMMFRNEPLNWEK